jgi:uncharacterized protein (DUF849 family)
MPERPPAPDPQTCRVLTLAPTGPIATTADNPHLAVTPAQIADAATKAYEAGASVVHVHLRDEHERPTADLDIAREAMARIADGSPILVQLSTGVGLGVPFEEREQLVELCPRMATLNPCSMTFGRGEFLNPPDGVRRLARRMRELGVKPELEIYDTGHLEVCLQLFDEGLLDPPLQFSIVMGVVGGMAPLMDNLVTMVRRIPPGSIWQIIAIGAQNLPLTTMGLAAGGNARTGLEDTLRLRRGVDATNDSLIDRLVTVTRALDCRPATIEETVTMLELPAR